MKFQVFIFCLMTNAALRSFSQIPNNGFEHWISNGSYLSPEGWWTPNDSIVVDTNYPVSRSTDHYPPDEGKYSLRMENHIDAYPDWASFGLAWTGDFSGNDHPVFPVPGHPISLKGYFKFLPQNNDTFDPATSEIQSSERTLCSLPEGLSVHRSQIGVQRHIVPSN